MQNQRNPKAIFLCDFDGTITVGDVSFLLLDRFAEGNWRRLLKEYRETKISVGEFNRRVFSLVKAGREEMLEYMWGRLVLRDGLPELVASCEEMGLRFVIVSNGLDFYIEEILKSLGLDRIEFHAAGTTFSPNGLKVRYVSPEGDEIDEGFKEAYTRFFLGKGYCTFYAGNGLSDFPAARLARHVYAIDTLLEHCRQANLSHSTFKDLREIVQSLKIYLKKCQP